MKKILIVFLFVSWITACKSDDVISSNSTVSVGKWKITSFVDNKARNRTDRYANFLFDFASGGQLQVMQGNNVFKKGTWSLVMDSGREKLYIQINGTLSDDDLSELNEDWKVVKITEKTMEFGDVSGGNGGSKTLIFNKI